jgi:4-amino-4-deoxy-L-arabinose transferase-like glycosyltransferase
MKMRAAYGLVALLACVLYCYGLGQVGLIGPDEPRYASIGREMARSGDWVTPRLWGDPWFEKPALLYWMVGLGWLARLGPELAPRLPVALLSLAFLVFFWRELGREFGERAAWCATLLLGTCAGWLGYSSIGVTDLPLAASFGATVLLALPWIGRGDGARLPWVSACLGAAVLAKGLVPLVLVAPFLWEGRRRWRDLLAWRVAVPFAAVAGPWYGLCYWKNGSAFFNQFIVEHHFSRFTSGALQHGQPWWFYLPVLFGLLLPWTPLLALLPGARLLSDPRTRVLAWSAAWGLLFFSASTNKLPGYLLPLFPALAALCGVALDRARRAGAALAVCAVLLVALPAASQLIAPALAAGLSRAGRPVPDWTWALPVVAAAAAWMLDGRGRRLAAVGLVAAAAGAGVVEVKRAAYPRIEAEVSARPVWRQVEARLGQFCVDPDLHRALRYGLNYYAGQAIPECTAADFRLRLVEPPAGPPVLQPATPRNQLPTKD